jgi:hypothetical protein
MEKEFDIQLAQGAEEIGLANMLQELLRQNLEQNPHKIGDFKKLRIPIGLIVLDAEIDLTMAFSKGTLTIHPGIKENPGLLITCDSQAVMALSNVKIKWGMPYYFDEQGKEVLEAMRKGRIKIKGMAAHFPSLVRLSRVMSVR